MTGKSGAVYNKHTGEIHYTKASSDMETLLFVLDVMEANEELFIGQTTQEHYIDLSIEPIGPVLRTEITAEFDSLTLTANGKGYVTLSDLPMECIVYLDDVPHEVLDGVFEFDAPYPGEYRVYVDEVEHIRKDWIINAD